MVWETATNDTAEITEALILGWISDDILGVVMVF